MSQGKQVMFVSGDLNQSGFIDGSDVSLLENNVFNS